MSAVLRISSILVSGMRIAISFSEPVKIRKDFIVIKQLNSFSLIDVQMLYLYFELNESEPKI
jgi:hypothetical protein